MQNQGTMPEWLRAACNPSWMLRFQHALEAETIPIENALTRVTAAPVHAQMPVPSWHLAACKGFAVRAGDTSAASSLRPVKLSIDPTHQFPVRFVDDPPLASLPSGTAIEVNVYRPLPVNADAVVRADTAMSLHAIEHGCVLLRQPILPGTNVIAKASEFAATDVLVEKGQRITRECLAALIAAGVREVVVSKRPRIGVVVSSYDRCAPLALRHCWQGPDASGPYVRILMQQWGFEVGPIEYVAPPRVAGLTHIERSDADLAYQRKVKELGQRYDLIVGCGMLSSEPYARMGLNQVTWFDAYSSDHTVDIKQVAASRLNFAFGPERSPRRGRRVEVLDASGRCRGAHTMHYYDRAVLVNLPGSTSSVALLMHIVVRRLIDLYEFVESPGPYWELGFLARDVECDRRLNAVLWGKIVRGERGEPLLDPFPEQGSHRIDFLLHAEVIVAIPASRGHLAAGSSVHFLRLDPTRQPAVPNCATPAPIEIFSNHTHSKESESMQCEMTVSQSWERLDAWLASAPDAIPGGLKPPATDDEIRALERELGVNLPQDFVASLKTHNGQLEQDGVFADGETLLDAAGILEQWNVWRSLVLNGDFDDMTSGPDDGVKEDWYNLNWIPFTHNGCGDHLCLDLDPEPDGTFGQVIRVWHDDDARQVVAPSFAAWLQETTDTLMTASSPD